MRRPDSPQAEEAVQLLGRLATVVVIPQVGLREFDVVAGLHLHARDIVASGMDERRRF